MLGQIMPGYVTLRMVRSGLVK